jgi:glycogen(starch) synthase
VWGAAALYVAPDDHDALRDCLARLIDDAELRRRLGAEARTRALRFTPERMVEAYLLAYSRIARRRSARPAPVSPMPDDVETACAS